MLVALSVQLALSLHPPPQSKVLDPPFDDYVPYRSIDAFQLLKFVDYGRQFALARRGQGFMALDIAGGIVAKWYGLWSQRDLSRSPVWQGNVGGFYAVTGREIARKDVDESVLEPNSLLPA